MMDKVNEFMAQAKKHYFWVLFGTAILITLACWFQATDELAGGYSTRASKLKAVCNDTSGLCRVLNHPNKKVIDEHTARTRELGKNVCDAWKMLYTEQTSKNRLPEGLRKKMSSAEFEQFKQAFESNGKFTSSLRECYQTFIGDHLSNLWTIIKCREPVAAKAPAKGDVRPVPGGPASGNAPPGEVESVGIVDWDPADRKVITERFKWPNACPSDIEVRLAQEDLWVYEALLRVIEKVNESATAHHNAPIKRILNLEIGSRAIAAFNKGRDTIMRIDGGTAGGSPAAPKPAANVPAPAGGATQPGQGVAAPLTADEQKLLRDRYLDAEGKPLDVGALGGEFKMMPVSMRLVVQQKMLPKLLMECANSSMPIEVRMIRLRTVEGQASKAPGKPAAGAPKPATGDAANDLPATFADTDITDLDVSVEVQGVIYIFNPPDKARFGLDSEEVSSQRDTAPTGTTPTVTTPADAKTPAGNDAKGSADKPTQEPVDGAKDSKTAPDDKTDKEASPAEGDAASREGA